MRHILKIDNKIVISALSLCLAGNLLTGCGGTTSDSGITDTVIESQEATIVQEVESTDASSDTDSAAADENKGTRDNTPVVLKPSADGTTTYGNDTAVIDASNLSEGYIVIDYKGNNASPKLQIIGPQGLTYNFDLHGGEEVFNLTQGDGQYQIGVYENTQGDKYAQLTACSVNLSLTNEFSPYLYPNSYVYFDENSNVVTVGEELAASADTDLDVVTNIYNYIISNVSYDRELAANVNSMYLPYPDRTLEKKTGICFDYASLMTALLRSQRIPTRMQVGYSGDAYHAWISTYIEDVGWVNSIVEFHGDTWELMDPTLASTTSERDLRSYIGDGSKYTVCYEY